MQSGTIVAVSFERQLRDATEIFNSFQGYVREHGLKWDVIPLNYAFESTLMQLAHSGKLLAAVGSFISDAWLEGILYDGAYAINLLSISTYIQSPVLMLIKQISVFKRPSICIKMACAILPTLALKISILTAYNTRDFHPLDSLMALYILAFK